MPRWPTLKRLRSSSVTLTWNETKEKTLSSFQRSCSTTGSFGTLNSWGNLALKNLGTVQFGSRTLRYPSKRCLRREFSKKSLESALPSRQGLFCPQPVEGKKRLALRQSG